ncbi:unnamed protein product [Rotaria sp. Silwood1]|nr:unnamed protein product [Rotaria sp. Silwood1]
MNYHHTWRYRTCSFRNICYDKSKKLFHFYQHPNSSRKPILFEPKEGHLYDFHFKNHGFVNLVARPSRHESWGPTIVDDLIPTVDVTKLIQPHVLFLHWHVNRFNPGHVIWEDIFAPFLTMVRLGEYKHKQAVLIEYKNFPPPDSKFHKLYNELVPAYADRVVSLDEYMNSFSTQFVCFKNVMAGGATPVFSLDYEHYNNGKERILYDYRSAILIHHGVDINQPPKTHRILLVNKTETNRRTTRGIKNLLEVERFLRQTYPEVKIDVINWKGMPFRKQMHELHSTTVLITPCGGVSSTVPFLPKGAHAIIMDYYVNKAAYRPAAIWKLGESGSMDSAIWNYFPHIRKLYYQVRDPSDFEFAFPGAINSRYDVQIIIKMPRLKELIDTAIQNSG